MFNKTLIFNYISHQFNAKTRHGIHSPFVYNLVDKVIYDFKDKPEYREIENLRKKLLNNDRSITITDLGAGSLINNNKQKKIKEVAKNALKSKKLAQLLYRLAHEFKPNILVELGTCLGVTSAYFSKAIPNGKIITMEGCPQTAAVAKENFNLLALNNVEMIVGNFDNNFPVFVQTQEKIDSVFIDGNHRKQATLDYFQICLPKIHEKSILIFDDIYWSEGMKQAWEQIKAHPRVTLTIDLFWIGLVFFRTDRVKEHFKIKF